ncbi:Branched-chain amino acid transport system permease protein livM (TC 3.A.1.4.1) [Paraburkholderia tropica]|uniref:branched-chain amino acid ABC transporter permease n=1 Tax=Paraburkholderia TaxID=1822464 RepID=UPI001CB19D32|nr:MULTISPECIES: branched-chain amino acid ABC transporter permease [Paraburkholderia]CAG9192431.1 Branched-chain amino acid transport system permease protein livM (TC 3.A.1.4.1) [Paraburkholderia tropica]
MMPTRHLGWLALFVIGLALPFLVRSDYSLTVMSTAFIFALATIGLNLLTGYTGQFNLAHGGFMAVGAYTVGILTVDYQVPFWIAFALAGVVSVVLGFFVGLVSLRLKGNYFAIFTLCVGYIIFLGIEKWDSLTHGVVGIIGIAAPPSIGSISFENPRALYYLTFAFLAAGMWIMHRIVNSLVGHTFVAIRNSEHLAQALGIDLMRNKMLAFLISTCYAGIAGGLYAGFVRFLGPDLANIGHTFDMTMYVVVGGIGTLAGPLLGAIALPWLTQSLQFMQDYRFLVFGPLLIVLLIFLPRGLVGLYQSLRSRVGTRNVAPPPTRRATSSGDGHA